MRNHIARFDTGLFRRRSFANLLNDDATVAKIYFQRIGKLLIELTDADAQPCTLN